MNKAGDLPLTPQSLARHFIGNEWVRAAEGRTWRLFHSARK